MFTVYVAIYENFEPRDFRGVWLSFIAIFLFRIQKKEYTETPKAFREAHVKVWQGID